MKKALELRDKIESRQPNENLLRNRIASQINESLGKLMILRKERCELEQLLDGQGISYQDDREWQYYKHEIIKIREIIMILQELLK